jgi:hypothetical protein
MSFKTFIYYCMLSGGWAAFLAWVVVHTFGIAGKAPLIKSAILGASLTGLILGLTVAGAVGAMDALLNARPSQRTQRVLLCMGIGLVGGLIGALIGSLLVKLSPYLVIVGWMLTGGLIGASIGVYDLLRAISAGEDSRVARKKVLNGVLGGLVGGLIGSLPFEALRSLSLFGRSGLTIGLVLLGLSIGLMIGLAQVFLKEAWIKIEEGFRAGREVMLTREATSIGRAEACDIGLFRDNSIEKTHARIFLQNNRYLLNDEQTPTGTFLNGQRIMQPTLLQDGDLIGVGNCKLRFGERQKNN